MRQDHCLAHDVSIRIGSPRTPFFQRRRSNISRILSCGPHGSHVQQKQNQNICAFSPVAKRLRHCFAHVLLGPTCISRRRLKLSCRCSCGASSRRHGVRCSSRGSDGLRGNRVDFLPWFPNRGFGLQRHRQRIDCKHFDMACDWHVPATTCARQVEG